MPRVKIDYVVSFSSEDPENQANNLLAWDVNKKMWLCKIGEPSCSVVLQLARAVKIESITIGTYHTALLEVLVGLSEKPDAPFEVLVPCCAVLSPREARAGPAPRVRSFTSDALVPAAREKRWDRVRVVCTQPYDKHCKYGLSFVHAFEPETPRSGAPGALSQRVLRLDALSEDEEEFRPGELFAKHSQELQKTNTDSQIRQATSQALKNIPDSSTKLIKTPISKTNVKNNNRKNSDCSNREKNSLLYTDDDEQPHAKIDHVVQRHKDQKQKDETAKKLSNDDNEKESNTKKQSKETNTVQTKKPTKNKTPNKKDTSDASGSSKKRKSSMDDKPVSVRNCPPGSILSGVVFSLSGYVNPERASLRAAAVGMGAQYRADWGPDCTHLICAFPNTPRLRALRSQRGAGAPGALVPAATGAWITACARTGRRLSWRAFATEPHLRDMSADDEDEPTAGDDADGDTDDEIEKALHRTKKKRAAPSTDTDGPHSSQTQKTPAPSSDSPPPHRADTSNDSDVTFVRDERVLGSVTVDSDDDVTDAFDCDTDPDTYEQETEEIDEEKSLPLSLDGVSVSVCGLSPEARGVVSRYVTAYGGLAIDSTAGVAPASVASLWRHTH